MQTPTVAELVPILQTAIGPVILISGVGLLLMTMTNRLGRAIDRARATAVQMPHTPEAERLHRMAQLKVLWHRARLIRLAITLSATSALCAAVLVAVLFLTALFRLEIAWLIGLLFILCMAALIASLVGSL